MYRSAVLATLASGITLALLTAELQPAESVWRIGYLGGGSRERLVHVVEALESGLRDLGYVKGRNAVFEHRFIGLTISPRVLARADEVIQ